METPAEINNFLSRFHAFDNIDIIFTNGCCYWFSLILNKRFPNSTIMYDVIQGHFVTKINNRLYDITGDVTDKYDPIDWDTFPDKLQKERIIRDCINF